MESLSPTNTQINSLESDFQTLTIQSNLLDIINLIKRYQDEFSNKNKKQTKKVITKKKTNVSDIDLLVQSVIQKQIKNYIDKIESNLKKYWYTDMELKLYSFLTDLKINWGFFEPYFQIDESIDYLEETIYTYVLDLKKHRSELEIDELLKIISNTLDYWPIQKAQRCLELAAIVDRKDELEHTLIDIQKQEILYNIENSNNSNVLTTLEKKYPLFQDSNNNKDILELLKLKIEKITQQESYSTIDDILNILEETIVQGSVWDQTKEQEAISKFSKLDLNQQNEFFKRFIQLLKFYYSESRKSNSIINIYPELTCHQQLLFIDLTYEGVWSLDVYFKGAWIPGYRLKDQSDFTNVAFEQNGEWKNRKFKCFSWTLKGKIPNGTILKLTNKKEILCQIITKTTLNHVRDINLTSIDENLIKNLFNNLKELKSKTNNDNNQRVNNIRLSQGRALSALRLRRN